MTLKDIISFNKEFKSGINLYLSLNKKEKVRSYIPTNSSLRILDEYLRSTISNREQATLLIGPYGKGKSHLLLVLLAVLSMERSQDNKDIVDVLIKKIDSEDDFNKQVKENIKKAWGSKPYLPIVLNSTNGDLNQAFLMALNESLLRAKLNDLVPDTYYSIALQRIDEWEKKYPDTYDDFKKHLVEQKTNIDEFVASLRQFSSEALEEFKTIYPEITAGSEFNPLAASEVLPLYKGISEQLVENYGYSGIYIVFDEFSKFIEGQDGKLVGNNMKLLQDICELAGDSQNARVFITLVAHKSIKEYGKYLSQEIINAFTGIEGRIIEKYFVTSSKNNYELIKNAIIKSENIEKAVPDGKQYFREDTIDKYYAVPAFRTKFQREDFINIIFYGCFPLNPIAAYLLLNISEKVAQNERTLFTFISNDEPNSLARYVRNHEEDQDWVVGADLVYDYFKGLFKKSVSNELIHNIWLCTEYALEKAESDDEKRLIKALAIILAVNKEDELAATDASLRLAVNVSEFDTALENLQMNEVVYRRRATGSFAFKTKAGSALKVEIKKRREIKGGNANFSLALKRISDLNFIVPRKYNTDYKMTRYFKHEFMDVNVFMNISNGQTLLDGCLDGKVLKLYSFSKFSYEDVERHFEKLACDQLVVVIPGRPLEIKKQLTDYEILCDLKSANLLSGDDEVLCREIPVIEEDITQEVQDTLTTIYGKDSDAIVLSCIDGKVVNGNAGTEEQAVNDCCKKLYEKCPVINNEVINRNNIISAQTKKARINIISALLTHTDTENFYSGTNQEATIYRSLFVRTGIIGGQVLPDRRILQVINVINQYIDECADKKNEVMPLVRILTSKPYGMRKGILSIYLAYVFSTRKEDLILYLSGMEVQIDPNVIINIVEVPTDYELYVSKEDVEKERYIGELREIFHVDEQRNLTDNRIKNIVVCMQRWFRSLPQAARNLTSCELITDFSEIRNFMKGLRNLLQRTEINPYEMLFVSLPEVLGTSDYAEIRKQLDLVITAFEDYLDHLVSLVVKKTYDAFGGEKKKDLYHLLKEWYEKQSSLSKEGLHDGKITLMMSFVSALDIYDDPEISKRLAKVITDVYIDNWIDGSIDAYEIGLNNCKSAVELIRDGSTENKQKLVFMGATGKEIEKFYDRAPEGTGTVLRNIIEDALDEYDDLSVNDRVSILLDMIEKIIG